MQTPRLFCLLISFLWLSIAGCGGGSALGVQGSVTLDGEPVANGSIVFLPAAADGPKGAAAVENGKYAIPPETGLKPGKYRVEVSWQKPTGKKIPSADPGMTIDETREAVPAKFNTASTLTAEIDGGDKPLDFALTTR